jgi:hypothetical protein
MSINMQNKNMTEEVKAITMTQKEFKKCPVVTYQCGEVMEDNSIVWNRKSRKEQELGWEDGCVVLKDCLYGCVCDGIYFEWNPTNRFTVARKNMDQVLEDNTCCFRILEVLPKAEDTVDNDDDEVDEDPLEDSEDEDSEDSEDEDSEDEE